MCRNNKDYNKPEKISFSDKHLNTKGGLLKEGPKTKKFLPKIAQAEFEKIIGFYSSQRLMINKHPFFKLLFEDNPNLRTDIIKEETRIGILFDFDITKINVYWKDLLTHYIYKEFDNNILKIGREALRLIKNPPTKNQFEPKILTEQEKIEKARRLQRINVKITEQLGYLPSGDLLIQHQRIHLKKEKRQAQTEAQIEALNIEHVIPTLQIKKEELSVERQNKLQDEQELNINKEQPIIKQKKKISKHKKSTAEQINKIYKEKLNLLKIYESFLIDIKIKNLTKINHTLSIEKDSDCRKMFQEIFPYILKLFAIKKIDKLIPRFIETEKKDPGDRYSYTISKLNPMYKSMNLTSLTFMIEGGFPSQLYRFLQQSIIFNWKLEEFDAFNVKYEQIFTNSRFKTEFNKSNSITELLMKYSCRDDMNYEIWENPLSLILSGEFKTLILNMKTHFEHISKIYDIFVCNIQEKNIHFSCIMWEFLKGHFNYCYGIYFLVLESKLKYNSASNIKQELQLSVLREFEQFNPILIKFVDFALNCLLYGHKKDLWQELKPKYEPALIVKQEMKSEIQQLNFEKKKKKIEIPTHEMLEKEYNKALELLWSYEPFLNALEDSFTIESDYKKENKIRFAWIIEKDLAFRKMFQEVFPYIFKILILYNINNNFYKQLSSAFSFLLLINKSTWRFLRDLRYLLGCRIISYDDDMSELDEYITDFYKKIYNIYYSHLEYKKDKNCTPTDVIKYSCRDDMNYEIWDVPLDYIMEGNYETLITNLKIHFSHISDTYNILKNMKEQNIPFRYIMWNFLRAHLGYCFGIHLLVLETTIKSTSNIESMSKNKFKLAISKEFEKFNPTLIKITDFAINCLLYGNKKDLWQKSSTK